MMALSSAPADESAHGHTTLLPLSSRLEIPSADELVALPRELSSLRLYCSSSLDRVLCPNTRLQCLGLWLTHCPCADRSSDVVSTRHAQNEDPHRPINTLAAPACGIMTQSDLLTDLTPKPSTNRPLTDPAKKMQPSSSPKTTPMLL